jgi:hypothetical protein
MVACERLVKGPYTAMTGLAVAMGVPVPSTLNHALWLLAVAADLMVEGGRAVNRWRPQDRIEADGRETARTPS